MMIGWSSVSLITLAGCAFVTTRQVRTWSDSRTLFAHAVALDPANYVARNLLGTVLLSQGEVLAAREQFDAAQIANRSRSPGDGSDADTLRGEMERRGWS